MSDLDNHSPAACTAWHATKLELIPRLGLRDLLPGVAPFEEQTQRTVRTETARQLEQKPKRGKRPARHHIGLTDPAPPGKILDAPFMDLGGDTRVANDLRQKSALAAIRLDEMYELILMIRDQNGNHKSGETPSAAQINPDICIGSTLEQLCAVGEVAVPHIVQCRWRDQIHRALPLFQQLGIDFELFHSFTWNGECCGEIDRSAYMRQRVGHLSGAPYVRIRSGEGGRRGGSV